MITEIGITAGDIWHYLDQHKEATVDEMTKGIGKSRELILMSLGWLAREGHVSVMEESGHYRTWLNTAK
ncbi:MAG TPA: winged helix-turn-helix domain-containing protein [Candidatus Omnitrophota bacterium]|nr:winged helix-turn-helix domain-containing protein [Candidatus Omnitrophota bacterium]